MKKGRTPIYLGDSLGAHQNSSEPNIQFASSRPSSASAKSIPLWPMSPKTSWTLSPMRTSPSQPLLYHCIASLHHHEGNIFSIALAKYFRFTGSESRQIHIWKQPGCTEIGYIRRANSGQVNNPLGQWKNASHHTVTAKFAYGMCRSQKIFDQRRSQPCLKEIHLASCLKHPVMAKNPFGQGVLGHPLFQQALLDQKIIV